MALIVSLVLLSSCAPVLSRDHLKQGVRDIPLSAVREDPTRYTGRLFILGGLIVETRLTDRGSLIEAVSVPVGSYGYLKSRGRYEGRFLALYPKLQGILDPLIYGKGREITLAATFLEVRNGKIDEMEYTYPVFTIAELYLWDEPRAYYVVPAYPWYYGYPYGWHDPPYYPRWRYYPPPPSWYWPRP